MMTYTIDATQRKWAIAIGASYLLAILPSIFAEFYVTDSLLVLDDAAQTARNIMHHSQLFMFGTAANLLAMCVDVVLITGLYMVLERVSRGLAILALLFRLLETSFLMIAAYADFNVMRLVSGAPYLSAIGTDQLAAMARLSMGAHGDAYRLALLLFGFGSTVFCYLWLESRYIPRWLARFGIFASAFIGLSSLLLMVFPALKPILVVQIYGLPIFLFEVTTGFWLVIRGIRNPQEASA